MSYPKLWMRATGSCNEYRWSNHLFMRWIQYAYLFTAVLYSRKPLREKTFANWWQIRISQGNLSWIPWHHHWCGCGLTWVCTHKRILSMPCSPKFADSLKTTTFTEDSSLKSYPLYSRPLSLLRVMDPIRPVVYVYVQGLVFYEQTPNNHFLCISRWLSLHNWCKCYNIYMYMYIMLVCMYKQARCNLLSL